MTTEQTEKLPEKPNQTSIVARFLPWIIAAAVLLVYLFTLSHWVTVKSLPVVSKIAGWDWHPGNLSWRPTTIAPLHSLVTYPFGWLAGTSQLVALNFFAAMCAALTLALLARSVSILPHDRTREQRQRETGKLFNAIPYAWLPPLAAVMVCGLQLTFWENAIAATGEMLDLLLFAYVIRCLLEYRITQRESWIAKFAFVYGLGIANNWAMIGFIPLFLVALIWIKGASSFNFRFVSRLAIFGAIGLSLYLLFPLLTIFSSDSHDTFFGALRDHLRYQKNYLFNLPFVYATSLRSHLFMIALTSLLPLMMIGIRWPSFRGDLSHVGSTITALMFRVMHLGFLAIGFWIFFDPKFSPRFLGFELLPFLSFYYLTALTVGYFIGYSLLIFGREPIQKWERASSVHKLVNLLILVATGVAAIGVPIALARKNYPLILVNNGTFLNQFSKLTAESLPSSNAVILSDDPNRLLLLKAIYTQMGKASDNILLETGSLPFPEYQQYLHKHFNKDFPEPNPTNRVSDVDLMQRLESLSKTHPIFYLHPSFGYYFEKFCPVPHKLVYELKPYPTNSLLALGMTAGELAENQTFWTSFQKDILPEVSSLASKSAEIKLLDSYYSRALNFWGTELQKAKRLDEAGRTFGDAIKLNPENVAAHINQQFNASLRKGEIRPVQADDELEKKLGQYPDLPTAIIWNGPFDEPNFCLRLGEILARGGNLRQSVRLFIRTLELTPKSFEARLSLAKSYIELQQPDESLKLIHQLRENQKTSLLSTNADLELLRVESLSYLAKNDFSTAEKILIASVQEHPKDENRMGVLTQLYLDTRQYTNALKTVQKQMQIAPQSTRALFVKAVLNMQLGQFSEAVTSLDQLLKLQPENQSALLNRAIANLQSGKLDDSKRDYNALLKTVPKNTFQIYYGLAQVAEKQKDRAAAIKNYKLYLKYAPAGGAEAVEVKKHLKTLENEKN